ncbi:MAG: methyltransferase [Clostridiales bacterium]|nr:methyltransferase [Candidatus Cacconaster stercorequi]
MEKLDQLWPDGYRFYFDDTLFQPSTDSFVLGAFPRLKRGLRICDLGSGSGLLGLLLLARQEELSVTNVELQRAACNLSRRNAALNGLGHRIITVEADLRSPAQLPPAGSFDLVVSNPPYFPPDAGLVSPDAARGAARSEICCTLADVCTAASRLLTYGGRFCLVFRPERMVELFLLLRKHGLEPKRLRFVHHTVSAAPKLLLLESRKGGHPGLAVEPPLVLRNADGTDTEEYNQIYFRNKA